MKKIQIMLIAVLLAGGLLTVFAFTNKGADNPFATTKLQFNPPKGYRFSGSPFASIIASDLCRDANNDGFPDYWTDVTSTGFTGTGATDNLDGISFNSSELTPMQAVTVVKAYDVTNGQLPAHGQTVPVTIGSGTYYVAMWMK